MNIIFGLSRLDIGECNTFYVEKINDKNFEIPNLNYIDIFLQKLMINYQPFSIAEIIGYILTIPNYNFTINGTNYILYPTRKLVQLSGTSELDIGYFNSISVINENVVLEFYIGQKHKSNYFQINIIPHSISKANLNFVSINGNLGYTLYMSELFHICENINIFWTYNSKNTGNSFLEYYFGQNSINYNSNIDNNNNGVNDIKIDEQDKSINVL